MIEIAKALQARGLTPKVASHGGPFAYLLDEAGLRWQQLEPAMDRDSARRFVDAVVAMGQPNAPPLHEMSYLRAAVRSEVDHFEQIRAEMVVTGFNLPSYLSARRARIPLATSHGGAFVPATLKAGLCPVPVNPVDPHMSKLPRFIQRWLANRVPRWLKSPTRELNQLAAELGVLGVPTLIDMMVGDLTLVTEQPDVLGLSREKLEASSASQAREPSMLQQVRFVGPLFAKLPMAMPPRVQSFLAQARTVYLALTSANETLVRAAITAIRAAGAQVLVAQSNHEVDVAAHDVLVERLLPSHEVMPRVAAAVIMGGQGSVQTAIASGTPFVGMPLHGEQELNVACAERLGMALRVSPREATTGSLTAAVRRLLDDGTFRIAADRAKTLYEGVDGAARCADAILAYLEAGPRTSTQ
jgi:UDP:flavonoid glycosyltransferase YjiC (YdhE family)